MLHKYLRQIFRFIHPLIYARRQFKLFLNVSFDGIRARTLALASATDYFAGFVRSIPIQAPFGESMLVLAPHQDDEAIGCGGAIALQARAGKEVAVLMLTDGADGSEGSGRTRQEVTDLRNNESRAAARVVGIPEPVFLDRSSLEDAFSQVAEQIRGEIIRRNADAIFVPFILDAHPDHRTTNYLLAEALRDIERSIRILQYEVWGLCIPNVVLVIDDVIDTKLEMIDCFALANSALDYTHSTRGLNMFHSRMLPAGTCRYAERFFELPSPEYVALVSRIRQDAENTASGRS